MRKNTFSQLYHHYTKREECHLPSSSSCPEERQNIEYKTYPRFPKIMLMRAHDLNAGISTVLRSRGSRCDFSAATSINLHMLSTLLLYTAGEMSVSEQGNTRRAYPSLGSRYPLEIYCLVMRPGDNLQQGLYHYNVKSHSLSNMRENLSQEDTDNVLHTYASARDASVLLFFTAIFSRAQEQYGERGYRIALLEAGHIGQNALLVAEALTLKACSLGGDSHYDDVIDTLLCVDGVSESLLYSIAIGT